MTQAQKQAARKNIKKSQEAWQSMSPKERAEAQPEGGEREKPGAGGGEYYRIIVRPKEEFTNFRYHDVGKPGHIQRLAGQRQNGSWDTQAWLISKQDAHIEKDKLVPDSQDAKQVLAEIGSEPKYLDGDRFEAKP